MVKRSAATRVVGLGVRKRPAATCAGVLRRPAATAATAVQNVALDLGSMNVKQLRDTLKSLDITFPHSVKHSVTGKWKSIPDTDLVNIIKERREHIQGQIATQQWLLDHPVRVFIVM